jgi:hypothetical protein
MIGHIWNNYLTQQYLWDGTCGYHAVNNTLNIMHFLNKYHLIYKNLYTFDTLLEYASNDITTIKMTDSIRNYYLYLNNGNKRTTVFDLIKLNNKVDNNNLLFFWDDYQDRNKIVSLIQNKIDGVYGIIIYYGKWWVKHWFGIVIDIKHNTINVHLVDSFSLIWPHTTELKEILDDLNLPVEWPNNYYRLMIYSYKIYQCVLFIFVYFVIIYAILLLLHEKNKL